MADFIKILPTAISVDQPLTVQLFDKLRQNPLAIAANSNSAEVAPKYLQPSIEDSTATAESKDRMVAFRKSARSVNSSVSNHAETIGYKFTRSGVYGLHIQNAFSSGAISCKVYVNDVELTSISAADFWSLVTVKKDDVLHLNTLSVGAVGHTTRMYLYTNNPTGDMQLMSGFSTSKSSINSIPDNDGNDIELIESGVFIDKDIY